MVTVTVEEKRGAKKQPRLDKHEKQSITKKAIAARNAAELSQIVSDNLGAGLPANIAITPEQYQIILTRVTGGETVRAVCKTLGLPHGTVYARSAYDSEFADDFLKALEIGQHSLVDTMAEVAMDPTISVERARLIVDVIKWQAARRNRNSYGDKVTVDANIRQVPVVMPDHFIDVTPIKPESDD